MQSSSSCADTSIAGTSFIRKLYEILNDEANNSIICWKPDGMSFEICSPKRLETEILPKFFRHSRFQSLIRQLNFYAFKKTTKERSSWVYSHDLFQREKPELLDNLRRKTNSSYAPHPISHEFVKPERSLTRPHVKISSLAFPRDASRDTMDEIDDHHQNSSFYLTSMSGSYFNNRPASSSSSASLPVICGATASNTSASHQSPSNFSHNPLELLSQVASLTPPGAMSSVLSNALSTLKKARMSCAAVEVSDLNTTQIVSADAPSVSKSAGPSVYPEESHAYEHGNSDDEHHKRGTQPFEPRNSDLATIADDGGEAGGADAVEGSEGAQDGHDSATSSITMKNGDSSSGDESSTSKSTSKSSASSTSSRREAARTRASMQGEEAELQRLLSYFDSKMSISSKKVVMFCILHNPWLNPAQLCVDICNLLASDFLIATEMDRYMDLTYASPQPHLKARTHAFLLRSTMLGQPLPLPLALPLPVTLPGVVTMPTPEMMAGMLTHPSQVNQSYGMPIYPHSHSLSPESYFATSHSIGNLLPHVYTEGCQCQSCLSMFIMSSQVPMPAVPSEAAGQAQSQQPHVATSAPVPLINSSGNSGDKSVKGTTDAFTSSNSLQTSATSSSSLEQSDTNYMRSSGNKNGSNTVTSSLTGGTSSESDNGGSGSSRNSDNNDDRNSDSPLNQEGNESDESSDGAKNPGGVKNDLSYFNMRTHNNATQGNPSFANSDTTGTGSDDNSLSSDNGSQNDNNNGSSSSDAADKRRDGSNEQVDAERQMKRARVDNTDAPLSSVNGNDSELSLASAAAQAQTEQASAAASVRIGPAQTSAAQQLQQVAADECVKLAMAYNLHATHGFDAAAAAATMSYVQTYADMAYEGCDFFMLNVVEIESMKMFVPFALSTVHTARDILFDVVRRHANNSSRKSSNDDSYNYRLNSERKFLANLDACVTAWSEYSTTFCT